MAVHGDKIDPPMLDGVTATGASRWINVAMYDEVVIHLSGLLSGDTVEVEGTLFDDKSNPNTLYTQNDAGDIITIDPGVQYLRLNVTAVAGGGTIDSKTHLRQRL